MLKVKLTAVITVPLTSVRGTADEHISHARSRAAQCLIASGMDVEFPSIEDMRASFNTEGEIK